MLTDAGDCARRGRPSRSFTLAPVLPTRRLVPVTDVRPWLTNLPFLYACLFAYLLACFCAGHAVRPSVGGRARVRCECLLILIGVDESSDSIACALLR